MATRAENALAQEEKAVKVALAVITSDNAPDIMTELDQLQFEQFEHDEMYHREITRLPLQQRLRHMTLHFAKYSGNLVEAEICSDEAEVKRIITDIFIIGMSTANALNFRLCDEIRGLGSGNILDARQAIAATVTIHAGRMAAACEKLDHLEDFPFRPVIRSGVIGLVGAAAAFAADHDWSLGQLVHERLESAKARFIHRDRSVKGR